MAAILPGYEYDIFISYRQNDNRSGWVSEFVNGLQEELASAVKYPVSVYFDSNPHDGLLGTHSVDKTLEVKLKCLIFIPVISQTYCDSTSFAWNNEFLAFRDLARNDPYTLNIRLANGNISSRILPIRIHALDHADQTLFERESGGALRAVDFVFSSPGVNRPLRSKDDDVKEINHSLFYRDQINKVANAIRDLLVALKTPYSGSKEGDISPPSPIIAEMSTERKNLKLAVTGILTAMIIGILAVAILFISRGHSAFAILLLIIDFVLFYFSMQYLRSHPVAPAREHVVFELTK